MKHKQKLGQFFTTNVDYILTGMEEIVKNKKWADPFAGQGDLLKWAKNNGAASIIGCDLDENLIDNQTIYQNDSLINMPTNKNIITNPPYLAKNKMGKSQKEKYLNGDDEDLYIAALRAIMNANTKEGIIVVPINFISAENTDKLRTEFFSKYNIVKINYFRERVFDDTSYNVISMHFIRDDKNAEMRILNITFFPENETKVFNVEKQFAFRVGGRELNNIIKFENKLRIRRLTNDIMNKYSGTKEVDCFFNDYETSKTYKINNELYNKLKSNIILLNCIDGKMENKINCDDVRKYNKLCLVGKNTSRNIAYIFMDNISIKIQENLIDSFNLTLNKLREKYNSLFLTNFRDGDRKRISFDFCYKLLNYCYAEIMVKQ